MLRLGGNGQKGFLETDTEQSLEVVLLEVERELPLKTRLLEVDREPSRKVALSEADIKTFVKVFFKDLFLFSRKSPA